MIVNIHANRGTPKGQSCAKTMQYGKVQRLSKSLVMVESRVALR